MMQPFSLSTQAHEPVWLSQRDPRARLLAALAFTLLTVGLSNLWPLLAMLFIALSLTWLAGSQWQLIAKRMLAFEGFMLLVLLLLPFTVRGETWFVLGGLTASQQGGWQALYILLRGNSVLLAVLALLGPLEPVRLGYALSGLGLPEKLVQLFMLTVRYISVLFDEYQRLRTAMFARSFVDGSRWHCWRSYGWLLGMLLVRSMDRANRISDAMRCRGFDGRFYLLAEQRWCRRDSGWLLLALGLFLLPWLWQLIVFGH